MSSNCITEKAGARMAEPNPNVFLPGRAAELAGLSLGHMITTLAEYGVDSNLDREDYRQGLENLRKVY